MAFCLSGGTCQVSQCLVGDRKIAALLFGRGVRIPTDTMHYENHTEMGFFAGSELDLNILTIENFSLIRNRKAADNGRVLYAILQLTLLTLFSLV